MARKKSEPSAKIKQFTGLNNREEPRAMEPGELTQADNVDIDDRNRLRRRKGFTLSKTMTSVTAAWATPDERRAFIVDDGILYEIHGNDFSLRQLATGLTGDCWFDTDLNQVYVSNEQGDYLIDDLDVIDMAVPTPSPPEVTITTGNLPAGDYLVGTIYKDRVGREGGVSTLIKVTVPTNNSGIRATSYAMAGFDPIHCFSETNATVLRYTDQIGLTGTFEDTYQLGSTIEEVQYDGLPMIAGGPMAYHQSRLYKARYYPAAKVSEIYVSYPFWVHMMAPHDSAITVDGEVRMLADVGGKALLIGTDRAVWARGTEGNLEMLDMTGVPEGSSNHFKDETERVYFWTEDGLCRALPYEKLTHERVSAATGVRSALGMISEGGFERIMINTRVTSDDETPNTR